MKDEKDYTIASRGGPGTRRPVVIAEVEHHDAPEPAGVRQHKGAAVGVRVRRRWVRPADQSHDESHSH